jgi:ribosomal protein L16/L10AE
MRVHGVPGQGKGRGDPAQVSRVQSGVVLQQGARRAAHARARESLRRADSDLRLPEVQGTSRRRYHVSPVQGGDVLQQEAQDEVLVGARE